MDVGCGVEESHILHVALSLHQLALMGAVQSAGSPTFRVQKLAPEQMTMERYAKALPEAKLDAARRMDAVISDSN